MLTMLEEVVLLAVDETTGSLQSTSEYGTAYALVGAVFFDLALAGKIDTDLENIQIIDRTPTGNATLDRVLHFMISHPELTTVRQWIEELFRSRQDLEGDALRSLIARGILHHEKSKRFWIIDVDRFPIVNDKPQLDVKTRLANVILTDEIPDVRDIMLVSLAEACGMLGFVFREEQLTARKKRIQLLCGLETISRKVTAAITDLSISMHQTMTTTPI
jgi:golgi phosphoprotein 3